MGGVNVKLERVKVGVVGRSMKLFWFRCIGLCLLIVSWYLLVSMM